MIQIKYSDTKSLDIILENNTYFSPGFLESVMQIFSQLDEYGSSVKLIRIKGNAEMFVDNLVGAYIYNIAYYIKKKYDIPTFAPIDIYNKIQKVEPYNGSEYRKSEKELNDKDIIKHYSMKEENFNGVIDDLTNQIINTNTVFNKEKIEEFMKTTIGEIFSNAVNHNDVDTFYFFKDLDKRDDTNLMVNVIDYGNTIIANVDKYLKESHKQNEIDNMSHIEWALKKGNTTRKGSGGYGLSTLVEYVNSVSGKLIIVSGHEMFSLENQKMSFDFLNEGYFPGTIVSFSLKIHDLNNYLDFDEEKNTLLTRSINLSDI